MTEGLVEVAGALACLAIVVIPVVYFTILRNLPENLGLTPVDDDDLPPGIFDVMACYEDLGFERLEPAWRLDLLPKPMLVGYCHPGEGMLATVYWIPTRPPRLGYDCITPLEPDESGLTTGMDLSAGGLPLPPGCFFQLFPGAAVEELVAHHREAVAYLRERGLPARRPDPAAFEEKLRASFRRQRRTFVRTRLRNTLLALWRAVTKRTPHRGSLARQPGVPAQIEELRQGGASRDEELLLEGERH
jgi:hypothetical protein